MRTFRTTFKHRGALGSVCPIDAITTRALTKAQAEKQALDKLQDNGVRDAFGQLIESPDLTWLTVEVD